MVDVREADRLADVAGPDWDALVGDDGFYLSYDWLRYVETEPNERSRYLLASEAGRLVGALVLNWADDPLTVRYRPERFAELLGIQGRTLLAGGSQGYRSTLLLRPPGADGEGAYDRRRTLAALLQAALSAAREDGRRGIVLPFLPTGALAEVAAVMRVRAAFEMPEAEICDCDQGLDAYAERMTSRVRKRIRSDRARFAEAGWTIREGRLEDCWPDAARLLYRVQAKYGHTERTLTEYERTLAGQARELSDRSVVFSCDDDEGTAGISVCYRWRTTLYGRLVGFDYDRLRGGHEYFTTAIYERLEYAARHGVTRLHLGVGSWQAKGYRGAVLRPLWSAFIPAAEPDAGPGLELVDDAAVHRWMAEIANHGIRMDHEEWHEPLKFAAAH
jgi:predicted N-acyltransferase